MVDFFMLVFLLQLFVGILMTFQKDPICEREHFWADLNP